MAEEELAQGEQEGKQHAGRQQEEERLEVRAKGRRQRANDRGGRNRR